jgi:hypothetical protein
VVKFVSDFLEWWFFPGISSSTKKVKVNTDVLLKIPFIDDF